MPLLPGFLIGLARLVMINSTGIIAKLVTDAISNLSRWCLAAVILGGLLMLR